MFGYALRRLVLAIPLLIGITLISFVVIHLAPGEPTEFGTGDTPIQSDKEVRCTGSTSPSTFSTGTG